LFYGSFEALDDLIVESRERNYGFGGADGSRGHGRTVKDEMRELREQEAVLAARRLALRPVGQHEPRTAAARHSSHLLRDWKCGAAAPADAGSL
jgi:hypothetical protein